MPWCEECERVVEDQEVAEGGACPDCGTQVAPLEHRRIPNHFKFMIGATVLYLGYRAYQGITWLGHHL